ncbi:MAG TPA: 6-carboxytetrahydropterin synthase [Terriglobia bacterium]|nr:6-carboxytetrahydropterin synthase [Terriglobia bacterium]
MVYLTRRYRFSASHRLHNDALTAEENSRLYGKCDNAFGHGHNYMLEVTVAGDVDRATGMVLDLGIMDGTVEREVIERFDLTNLNVDLQSFQSLVPTTENVCIEIFDLLKDKLNGSGHWPTARLSRIRLEETNSNAFEYFGEHQDPDQQRRVR